MNRNMWRIVGLVFLMGLLFGCGILAPAEGTPDPDEPTLAAETPAGGGADPTAEPAPAGVPAVIEDVINEVMAALIEGGDEQTAEVDMSVYPGGHVRAGERSTALVQVDEGRVRVAPNTRFTYERAEDDLTLSLDAGRMWINVDGLGTGNTVEVETPSAVASVRGTRWSTSVFTDVVVFSTRVGTVTVSAGVGDPVDVGPGYQTTVVPGSAPSPPVPTSSNEQVWWGMATGDDLDIVLPVVGEAGMMTTVGKVSHPSLSSDGSHLAFVYYDESTGNYGPKLYDVNMNLPITTTLPPEADGISFNPVGDQMAYTTYDQICVANEDGSDPNCFGGGAFYGWPYWSPDGDWLLLYSDMDTPSGGHNLYKVRPDGSDWTQLTSSSVGYNGGQSWSPDGTQIAYTYNDDYSGPAELWVMDADGLDARQVFTATYNGQHPAWSHDGALLAVSGYRDGNTGEGGGLWFVAPDGSEASLMPGTDGWGCYNPTWSPSPSGWPLYFRGYDRSDEEVVRGVYWSPSDKDEPVYFGDAFTGPLWSTDGTRLVFTYLHEEDSKYWTSIPVYDTDPEFFALDQ